MRLPPFLRFLKSRIEPVADGIGLVGHLRIVRQVPGEAETLVHDSKNFIVNAGITAIRDALLGTALGGSHKSIFRMAVGDGGVPPAELFNPKLPDATWPARTALYHELVRQDISVFSTPTAFSMRFVGSFNSVGIDPSGYSLVGKVINEAALIIGDGVLTIGGDRVQVNKTSPDPVGPDEVMLATRAFKSVSFDDAEDVTITVTWTITIATV